MYVLAQVSEFERLADKFGVPLAVVVCCAVPLAVALYKVLRALADQHIQSMQKRDTAFDGLTVKLDSVCKARCPQNDTDK